jgi:hypothetical protein
MSDFYASSQMHRPWILSFVAVLSVVIASVSLMVDFISLSFANMVSLTAMMTPPARVNAPAPAANHGHSEYVGPQGLSSSQRLVVINGLSHVHAISDTRQKQLDGLLADVGQSVIQLSPENITPDRIATYVTDVREIPSSSGGEPDIMFMLGSGRLQLSDQNAVFFPENSPSPIRSGGGSYTDSEGTHLASEQIAAVVDRVRTLSNQTINDAQVTALEAEMEMTNQALITPSPSVTQAAAQVVSVQSLGDGTVAVTTQTGSMSFGPTGQSMQGVMLLGAPQMPWARVGTKVRRSDATLLVLDALLSMAVAGLLLASGVMALRNSPMSRWLHLVYAGVKIFLAAFSCYAIYTVAMKINANSPDARSAAMAWMIIFGAVGFIYPIVVAIVMNLKSVREFLSVPTVARIF